MVLGMPVHANGDLGQGHGAWNPGELGGLRDALRQRLRHRCDHVRVAQDMSDGHEMRNHKPDLTFHAQAFEIALNHAMPGARGDDADVLRRAAAEAQAAYELLNPHPYATFTDKISLRTDPAATQPSKLHQSYRGHCLAAKPRLA